MTPNMVNQEAEARWRKRSRFAVQNGDESMKGFINPLARRSRPGYLEAVRRIEGVVRTTLALPDDVVVSMAELACREPGCPDTETVIAILADGRDPVTVRMMAAIPDVAEDELTKALLTLDLQQLPPRRRLQHISLKKNRKTGVGRCSASS